MDDRHDFAQAALAELVGSRLCHDLVNPLSAISNGMELLQLSGAPRSPELDLIASALGDAMARVRFFRVAFGAARDGETLSERELGDVISEVYAAGRLNVQWEVTGDLPRREAKLAFLMLNCAETALPLGGDLVISRDGSDWVSSGRGRKLVVDGDLWSILDRPGLAPAAPPASRVQFAMLRQECNRLGAGLLVRFDEENSALSLRLSRL